MDLGVYAPIWNDASGLYNVGAHSEGKLPLVSKNDGGKPLGVNAVTSSRISQRNQSCLFHAEDAASERHRGGLGAVVGIQFGQNPADMDFNGDFGQVQSTADFFIAFPVGA